MNPDLSKLKDGDISVGDFDNDGLNDIVLPVRTSLVIQLQNYLFRIRMVILKNLKFNQRIKKVNCAWVDYDMDGDLDLFLTGIAGCKTLLYKSEILNKKIPHLRK
jgi:hypothetical protein